MTPRGEGSRGADVPAAAPVAFLTRALDRPLATDGLRVVSIPAPVAAPERLLGGGGPALFWTTPGAPVQAGLGIAHRVTGAGEGRFDQVRAAAERLWAAVETITHDDLEPATPRLFGGFAFLSGPPSPEWRSFGEATFVLPRLLYTLEDGRARLSVAVTARELAESGAAGVAGEAEALLRRLAEPALAAPPAGPEGAGAPASRPPPAPGDAAALSEWRESVASIQRRIEAGRAEKIVAARSRAVALADGMDLPAILRSLDRESATAARFAFRFGDAAFVGATPERLVGRSGRDVRTEALAGSVAAETPEREGRLLESLKEGAEHEYVVRAIADALAPLCERLDYPAEPRVQRLLHVLHLQTPFTGRLRQGVHVLELVERLHPTPAVGGLPREEALAWIEREEPGSRGWYAAPVGWFDAAGDGEFGVALRSGLLHRGRAHLYAGAGIVRGSDPGAEFDETEVKLRTMLHALRPRS